MAKIVPDANVIVGLLDEYDSLDGRALKVLKEIHSAGHSQLLPTLVALQRRGLIGEVATFDATLASQPDFQTVG